MPGGTGASKESLQHKELHDPVSPLLTCAQTHIVTKQNCFLAVAPPPPPPPRSSVPGHLVRGRLLCGTAADYVIISGLFWCVCMCVRN